MSEATRQKTVEALDSVLTSEGVPCAQVRDYGEVASDPQVLGGILRPEDHPEIPDYRAVGLPIVTDGERPGPRRPPPAVGEHTDEILDELGLTDTSS